MSDHADLSDKRIAQIVSDGLKQLRRAPRLHGDGRCHFCDVDCRDDYEKQQAALERMGR
ncbi:MAG TPA: hypothetical protein VM571_11475 [Noviherbaspirillum sp.]|nr:hypothetical protein [Noviherbaspirillum sp.]